jgi:hypothetical protein
VKSVLHPVGADYSKVRIVTGDVEQGEAVVSGSVGKHTHRMPIVVDSSIRERAEPPVNISAQAMKDGIVIRWKTNAHNTREIELDSYEIYRKKAAKITGEFQKVAEVKARKGEKPSETERNEEETPSAQGYDYQWEDKILQAGAEKEGSGEGVKPEETYRYKVRSIAKNSEPPNSEFSPVVRATTMPTVDYKFTGRSGNTIRFKVRVYQNGRVEEEECAVSVGEEIGVYLDETDGWQNFLTGCYLLDFQRGAFRRDPFAQGRVIVVNRRGEIVSRWEGEFQVEYLWDVEPGETVGKSDDKAQPQRPSNDGAGRPGGYRPPDEPG